MRLLSKLPALLLGAVLGAAGMHGGLEWRRSVKLKAIEAREASHFDAPEFWLFPPGTTFADLFPDADLRDALLQPDSIRIHEAVNNGPLKVGGWEFSDRGAAPDKETTERLKHALGSMSSYTGATMCVFHADVLLRLERHGRTHDLVFCFGCGDIDLGDGGPSMTERGRQTFLKCFCDTLPDYRRLHEMRAGL